MQNKPVTMQAYCTNGMSTPFFTFHMVIFFLIALTASLNGLSEIRTILSLVKINTWSQVLQYQIKAPEMNHCPSCFHIVQQDNDNQLQVCQHVWWHSRWLLNVKVCWLKIKLENNKAQILIFLWISQSLCWLHEY